MRIFALTITNLFFVLLVHSQPVLELVNSGGGHINSGTVFVDFAIGEIEISVINTQEKHWNEGFVQYFAFKKNKINPPEPLQDQQLKVYEFISANNDERNETLYISGLQLFPDNELIIFDKEGTQVFKQKNYDNSWNGGSLPSDNYFYVFTTRKPNQELKGGLVLTR